MTDNTKQLTVTAKPGDGVKHYEIKVRHEDGTVDDHGGQGSVASFELKTPGKYVLLGYVFGEVKSKLELEVTVDGVKWPKITTVVPESPHGGAGAGAVSAPFELVL